MRIFGFTRWDLLGLMIGRGAQRWYFRRSLLGLKGMASTCTWNSENTAILF